MGSKQRVRAAWGLAAVTVVVSWLSGAARAAVVGVEADITALDGADGGIALIIDYDGNDNLYAKVIVDPNTGEFAGARMGHGNDQAGWPGMTGGPSVFGFSERFRSAHMIFEWDTNTGRVALRLLNLDGDSNRRLDFLRGGWVNTPGGSDVGFGGDTNKIALDEFQFVDTNVCDAFERANGDIGRMWRIDHGTAVVQGGTARADGAAMVIWVCENCGVATGVEKLNAKCKERNGSNTVTAKVTKGLSGETIQFSLAGDSRSSEETFNTRGKAKFKWTDVDSGLQFVFASSPCGYTLESRPTCP
ncbi:MAG: hypothetical protein KJ057_01675 [Phycisphaerae bacterium]|nr:MAG: hypothetical protein F9K17_09365 [Phycisphaerae bacterium]MBE7455906.1 hypothetical protein [Planctomycetia bacterium]MCK6465241.1 hypothetical protein [Phycisphaerae bacterium]MCL4717164.1 hypothetical protein [Phycisphaerae bacterium]NUQ08556.1 hypothetical protein [Phycisphaerae bacterium]